MLLEIAKVVKKWSINQKNNNFQDCDNLNLVVFIYFARRLQSRGERNLEMLKRF